MAEKEIGKVVHYFDKAMVAVVKLSAPVALGDVLIFRKGENEFAEEVKSMQIDHETVKKGKKGEEVAIKVSKETKQGASVLKG